MPNDISISSIVVAIQGRPLSTDTPDTGDGLFWNGSQWEPTALPSSLPPDGAAGGDLDGYYPNPTIVALQGNSISNEVLGAGQDGYVLTWNNGAGNWAAQSNSNAKAVCGVYSNSTQSINSTTKISNWIVKFDTASAFDIGNSSYTIPADGYYHIDAQLVTAGTLGTGAGLWIAAYLNNVLTHDNGISFVGKDSQVQVAYSTIIFAMAGQILDLRMTVGGSTALTIQGADAAFNYMNIHQL